MRRTPSLPVLFVLLAALLAIALAAGIAWMRLNTRSASSADGTGGEIAVATGIQIGGPYSLIAQDGSRVTDETFQGKFQLIFFGFTFCPDVCPTELAQIAAAMERMGPDAQKVQPIFITVDPERDTPEAMGEYVRHFDPRIIGLTGSREEIDQVISAYRVFARKVQEPNSSQYVMDHSTFLYLLGPDGEFVTMYRYGTEPDELAKSLKGYVDAAG